MPPDTAINLEDFDNLVLRVKGDGRRYLASVRTDDWIAAPRDDDVWQAFIFARRAGRCCHPPWPGLPVHRLAGCMLQAWTMPDCRHKDAACRATAHVSVRRHHVVAAGRL